MLNDLSYNSSLTPIGNSSKPFAGTFEGGNHSITGLSISSSNTYVGLFGYASGTIKNLTLSSPKITGKDYIGGIVGKSTNTITNCHVKNPTIKSSNSGGSTKVGGIAGESTGTISNCDISSGTISFANPWEGWMGGIAGIGNNISSCHNRGTAVSGSNTSGPNATGGIIGSHEEGILEKCSNTGLISGYGHLGGVAGKTTGTVKESFNSASVTVPGNITSKLNGFPTGGVVGYNSGGNISICYNTGKITNNSSTATSVMTGGIVGYNSGGLLTKCYNIGTVTSKNSITSGTYSKAGAIVAVNDYNGNVTYCYALSGTHSVLLNKGTDAPSSSSNISFQSSANLKNLYGTLGMKAGGSKNSGYPILNWQ